jgi:hypothetical protein
LAKTEFDESWSNILQMHLVIIAHDSLSERGCLRSQFGLPWHRQKRVKMILRNWKSSDQVSDVVIVAFGMAFGFVTPTPH